MVPLLGIAAYSGMGKTTLLKKLIPLLRQQNIRLAVIKRTHHDMELDIPGKDSYELRKAGADQIIAASSRRWGLITETPAEEEPNLRYLASRFDQSKLDLILVEGFKQEPINKIALYRAASGRQLVDILDQHVIALASDSQHDTTLPLLDINQPQQIALFIANWVAEQKTAEQ